VIHDEFVEQRSEMLREGSGGSEREVSSTDISSFTRTRHPIQREIAQCPRECMMMISGLVDRSWTCDGAPGGQLLVQFSERFPYLCRRRRRLCTVSLSMTDVLVALCCCSVYVIECVMSYRLRAYERVCCLSKAVFAGGGRKSKKKMEVQGRSYG
jgi:hypothetical protein